MQREDICRIINNQMQLATGCTEPAAIALTAAYARERLPGQGLSRVTVKASVNVIKNAMCAGIPNLDFTGVNFAAALGATAGQTARQLMVVDTATPQQVEQAVELVRQGHVRVESVEAELGGKLFIEVGLESEDGRAAAAIIAGGHTNLIYLCSDAEVFVDRRDSLHLERADAQPDESRLTLREIYDFVESIDRQSDDLHMIEQAISVNSHIAELGGRGDYGLNVGRHIDTARQKQLMDGPIVEAVRLTATAADARMAGAQAPVVTNSGSGNQGITTTMPIVSAARSLGVDDERMFRAVTLSNLIAIYIHANFGLLSGLCGATVAATGAACGLTWLLGGDFEQIGYAINNMLGDVSGMVCDGAKADCALKISTCVWTAFLAAWMARAGVTVKELEGIVEQDPERTIHNFNRLGNEGSPALDKLIMDIMLGKTVV